MNTAGSVLDWLERLPALGSRSHGLTVAWFDTWHPALDEALRVLPELEGCPHELFRLLCQNPSPVRKVMALVSHKGDPVALAGLRRKRWDWEPVLAGMGGISEVMPARPGMQLPALAALGRDVLIWGWPTSPPIWVRDRRAMPVFKIDLRGDFEQFWRQSGLMSFIKQNRRRTKDFTFVVDSPEAAECAIRSWVDRFRHESNTPADGLSDYLLRATYLRERGQLHAFLLLDGDKPVASQIGLIHGTELLLVCPSRVDGYERQGVGGRLDDLICSWAAERGFTRIDLGPANDTRDYKARWGPVEGERWAFRVCPPHLEYMRRAGRTGRVALVSLRQRAAGALRPEQRDSGEQPG